MPGAFLHSWWRSPEGVLTRLECLVLRGWLNAARRDIRFGLSIVVIAGFVIAAVVRAVRLIAIKPDIGLVLAGVAGFALFHLSFIAPESSRWRQLRTGVLQPWTAFGPVLNRFVHLRAAALTLMIVSATTIIAAVTHPRLAVACFACMAAGAMLAMATTALGLRSRFRLPRLRLPRPNMRLRLPPAVRMSLAATFRRKLGIIPVWLLSGGLWALATPASALAQHNNPGTTVGFGMITVIGLICAIALAWPNLRLVRFLAFQPIPLYRIAARISGPQVALVALLAVAAGFGAAQPLPLALTSAAVVVGGVCLWLVLLIPYAMTRSVHAAPGMAGGELVVAAIVKFAFQFGLIAVGWLIVRAIANIRAVSRNRWRDPS
jgi:hypothetical protein